MHFLGQPPAPLVATKAAITATTQHVAHRIVLRGVGFGVAFWKSVGNKWQLVY